MVVIIILTFNIYVDMGGFKASILVLLFVSMFFILLFLFSCILLN